MALNSQMDIKATPLPPREGAQPLIDNFDALSAYELCLRLERNAAQKIKAETTSENNSKSHAASQKRDPKLTLVHARILGYLLLFAPSHDALAELAKEIRSCSTEGNQHDNLDDLGKAFMYFFIVPFRKSRGKTPAASEYSSRRSSFNRDRVSLMGDLREVPKDHKQAKERALYRDGYRCLIAGTYDMLAIELDIGTEEAEIAAGVAYTKCIHIVPECTYLNVVGAGHEAKAAYAATVLTVLERFGFPTKQLNGEKIHSLFNVMTMAHNAYDFFDRLDLWLEKTDITNQYRPNSSVKVIRLRLPQVITFTSPDPENLQVPSPELLALHAICAKVAHMSGAAKCINEFDYVLDHLDVLASDGSSSAALHHAIWEKLGNSVDVET